MMQSIAEDVMEIASSRSYCDIAYGRKANYKDGFSAVVAASEALLRDGKVIRSQYFGLDCEEPQTIETWEFEDGSTFSMLIY